MNPELSEAVRIYLGSGTASWPQTNTDELVQQFGERANQLTQQIDAILNEAGQFQPDWDETDLAAGSRLLEKHLRARRPELSDEAIKAVAWAWSYWNK